jgi:predicted flap endonuclease-1-like 5' DNA nuclease
MSVQPAPAALPVGILDFGPLTHLAQVMARTLARPVLATMFAPVVLASMVTDAWARKPLLKTSAVEDAPDEAVPTPDPAVVARSRRAKAISINGGRDAAATITPLVDVPDPVPDMVKVAVEPPVVERPDVAPSVVELAVPDNVAVEITEKLEPDDLTVIRGIGPKIADRLAALGITSFAQLAALGPDEAEQISQSLGSPGRATREDWAGQAATLAINTDR